jgi:hypothetical protein
VSFKVWTGLILKRFCFILARTRKRLSTAFWSFREARCELSGLQRPGLLTTPYQLRRCRFFLRCMGCSTTSTSARNFWPLHLKKRDVRASKPDLTEAMELAGRHGSAQTRDSSTTENTQDYTVLRIERSFGRASGRSTLTNLYSHSPNHSMFIRAATTVPAAQAECPSISLCIRATNYMISKSQGPTFSRS